MSGNAKIRRLLDDLRDRRLLPIVALLIAGIVAVPFLIRSDTEPVTPTTALGAAIEDAPELDSVVAAEPQLLRDFRVRLDGSRSKNPFKPVVPFDAGTDVTQGLPSGELETGGADATATGPTTPDSSGTPSPTGNTGNTTPAEAGDGTDDSGSDEPDGDGDDPAPQPKPPKESLLTYEIDIRVSEDGGGKSKKMNGVQSLAFIPGDNRPVIQYITSDIGGTRSSFVVSNAVIGARGDGQCAPAPDACQFLFLEPGQSENLTYDPNGKTYRVELLRIHRIKTPLAEVTNFANSAYASVIKG